MDNSELASLRKVILEHRRIMFEALEVEVTKRWTFEDTVSACYRSMCANIMSTHLTLNRKVTVFPCFLLLWCPMEVSLVFKSYLPIVRLFVETALPQTNIDGAASIMQLCSLTFLFIALSRNLYSQPVFGLLDFAMNISAAHTISSSFNAR